MKLIVPFCLSIILIAGSCKTYRNVENLQPKVSREIQEGPFVKESLDKLVEGDKVYVSLISGENYFFFFQQAEENKLTGMYWKKNGRRVNPMEELEIPVEEIDQLYVNRFSAGATVPVILVGGLGVFFAVLIIGFALGDGFW